MSVSVKALLAHSQLRQNILSGVFAAGLQAVSNLVPYPVYIYHLGYDLYGTWLILATLITLMQLGTAGVSPAISQLVAEAYARHEHQVRNFFEFGLRSLVSAYLVVGILAKQIFEFWQHQSLRPSQVGAFRILLVGSLVNMVGMSAYYFLIGLQPVWSVFQSYVIQVGLNVLPISSLALVHQVSVFWVCAATSVSIVSASLYLICASSVRLKELFLESSHGRAATQII
jgi:hypothetical protein